MIGKRFAQSKTGLFDGDDFGNEWPLGWRSYSQEDEGTGFGFDIYEDDGNGNGTYLGYLDTDSQVEELFGRLEQAADYESVNVAILSALHRG